jgi:hypothetical protein
MFTEPVELPNVPWKNRTRFSRRGEGPEIISPSHQWRSLSMSPRLASSWAANIAWYSAAVVSTKRSAVLVQVVRTNSGAGGRGARRAASSSASNASPTGMAPSRSAVSTSPANASRRSMCRTSPIS